MKHRYLEKGCTALALALLLSTACSRSVEAPAAAAPQGLPAGFKLSVYAEGLGRARFMSFGPDGTLYVGTNERSGKVWALPRSEERRVGKECRL